MAASAYLTFYLVYKSSSGCSRIHTQKAERPVHVLPVTPKLQCSEQRRNNFAVVVMFNLRCACAEVSLERHKLGGSPGYVPENIETKSKDREFLEPVVITETSNTATASRERFRRVEL